MKQVLYFFLLLLMPDLLYSQVNGFILDANTHDPVQDATIKAFDRDSTMIEGVITDMNGYFTIKAKTVTSLQISCLGFETLILKDSNGLTGAIGEILMNEKATNLEDVTITARLRSRDASVETIVVTDSLRKGTISTAQLLNKISGIRTDWITEAVKIGNENNIPIVVNGQEVGVKYAMSINPKRIKKVEIIRHPTGKYADYPIILNLELFENYIGWDISPRIAGMSSLNHYNSNRESASVDATWTFNKWNVYSSMEYSYKYLYDVSAFDKHYGNSYSERSSDIDLSHPNKWERNHKGKISLGVDYQINPKHIISLQTQVDLDRYNNRELYDVSVTTPTESDSTSQLSGNSYKSQNSAIRASYRGTLSDHIYLTTDLLYNYYHINEERNYKLGKDYSSESPYCGEKNYIRHNIEAIYTISSKWKAQFDNTLIWREYINRGKNTGTIEYQSTELRNRISGNVGYTANEKFEISAGGSLLTVKNSSGDDNRTTSSFIPYMKLYWQPIDLIELNLNYYNSVDYPNLDQLSTTQWQIDQFMIHSGNPDLKARIMHYAEIQIQLKKLFKVTYMQKISTNDISTFYEHTTDNQFVETLTNCKYNHSYLGIEGDYNLAKGLRLAALFNYQWYTRYKTSVDKRHGYTYTFDTQLSYTTPFANINLISGYYLRYDWLPLLQGREYAQEEMLSFGINKSFLKNQLPITLMVGVPTNLISKNTYRQIEIPGYRTTIYGDGRVNKCIISLNIRYTIGNGKARRYSNETTIEKEK